MESPNHFTHSLSAFFFVLSSLRLVIGDSGVIGINYGRLANNLPPPQQVVRLLKLQGITKVKLYDTDSTVLSALSGSGISVTVALPNEELSAAAADLSFTDEWVQSNILTYYPNTLIEAIAVGNEVFVDPNNTTHFLVPAMKNVYASLVKFGAASSIKVSSPIALSALQSSYPSSSGAFKSELAESVIKPLLKFLKQTDSFLMMNVYPFFAYSANADTISSDYALFRDNAGVADPNNGLVYKSLFEAQMDAVFAAMDALGFGDVKMVVSETGWPSKGDGDEIGAGLENAAAYNGNLVRRVLAGNGTPLRPEEPLNVYLFALFNENGKPGPISERNYGLFYPNEQKVYDISLTLQSLNKGRGVGQTWCMANGEVGEKKLREALDYVCDEGGVDCRWILPGGACYNPNSAVGQASLAFNRYYQKKGRRSGTCYFGGAAYVVTQSPEFGDCE
ncbi:glucan endo-1,3-beta-glucosidase 13-like [Primulina eburnea]|uniref:glucan endo-1,3-beta-glucosidase 13-like n=1 Tax=Primulina eburnea TaxID=1245227 RepID=UPI003C6C5BC6